MNEFIKVTAFDGRKFAIRKNDITDFKEEDWQPESQKEIIRSVKVRYSEEGAFVRVKEDFDDIFKMLNKPGTIYR